MERFALADLHLGHKNIHKFRHNPDGKLFESADIHDEYVMDMWSTLIPKNSLIYVAGDIAFNEVGLKRFKRLHGTKHIILGNHDLPITRYLDFCHVVPMVMKKINDRHIIMTHIPIHFTQLERWDFNIHGHIHEQPPVSKRHINTSLEAIEFIPRTLEELVPIYRG